jgi:hypothetical protein
VRAGIPGNRGRGVAETPCEARSNACEHGVPFGFAQGWLSTAVALRFGEAQPPLGMTKRRVTGNYGCFCQVWPSSGVVQTSEVEVVMVPFRGSENWMLRMSPVRTRPDPEGSTPTQLLPPSTV